MQFEIVFDESRMVGESWESKFLVNGFLLWR